MSTTMHEDLETLGAAPGHGVHGPAVRAAGDRARSSRCSSIGDVAPAPWSVLCAGAVTARVAARGWSRCTRQWRDASAADGRVLRRAAGADRPCWCCCSPLVRLLRARPATCQALAACAAAGGRSASSPSRRSIADVSQIGGCPRRPTRSAGRLGRRARGQRRCVAGAFYARSRRPIERTAASRHRRAGRGQRAAGGGAGGERRPARPAAGPGPGGRACSTSGSGWRGRSTTPSPRASPASSPSSRRPSSGRPSGRRGAATSTPATRLARESLAEARRSVQALRPAAARRRAGCPRRSPRSATRWSAAERRRRRADHHRRRRGRCSPSRGHAAADRAGGAGQRGQARDGAPGRPDPVLHGGRGDARRARRRRRLRPARAHAHAPHERRLRPGRDAAAGAARSPGTLEIESEPGGGTAISACVPAIPRGSARRDPAADRRRPPGRPGRAARHVRRRPAASRWSARPATAPRRVAAGRGGCDPDVVLMDLRMPGMDGVDRHHASCAQHGVAGPRAGADHVRHRQRRAARRSRPAPPATCSRTRRATSCSGRSGPPRRGESVLSPAGRRPADGPGARARAGAAQPARARGARRWSPRGAPTARRRPSCSSARRRSRPTCCTSTPSSASTTGPPPWRRRSTAGCSCRARASERSRPLLRRREDRLGTACALLEQPVGVTEQSNEGNER